MSRRSVRPLVNRITVIAAVMALAAAGSIAAGIAADTDFNGPLEPDQTAPSVNVAIEAPATPVPVEVVTTSPKFEYSTVLAEAEELDSPNNVRVISSTPAGSAAVTGVVVNGDNGAGVVGATVVLEHPDPTTAELVEAARTVTSQGGVFAFTDIPAAVGGTTYQLKITDPLFGDYYLANDTYEPDTTYELTASLTSDVQWYDESTSATQVAPAALSSNSGYDSNYRVPPSILVGKFNQTSNCAKSGTSYVATRYPWKFYLLHVAVAEIDTRWNSAAWKANADVEQNYAWAHRIHPDSGNYDIDNTTSNQCFRPERKIPTSNWRTWVPDVLDERVQDSSGNIAETGYRAGTYSCSETAYPANGNLLSQNGSRALDNNCGYSSHQAIVEYYYTYTVDNGAPPPRPDTSATPISQGVRLNFPAHVAGSNDHVGWHYQVDAKIGGRWVTIYDGGWDSNSRTVPTAFNYKTTQCLAYRANASNPVGTSAYATFGTVCPG